ICLNVSLVAIKRYFSSRSFRNPKTVHTSPNGISYRSIRCIRHQTGFLTAQYGTYATKPDIFDSAYGIRHQTGFLTAQDGAYGTKRDFLPHKTTAPRQTLSTITTQAAMPSPPGPEQPSIAKPIIPDSKKCNSGHPGQQPCRPKCTPYFSTLINASWHSFGRPNPTNGSPFNFLSLLANFESDGVYNLLQRRQCMMFLVREYTKVQQEELSKGIGLEESMTRAIRRITSEEDDLGRVDVHEFADKITEALRWQNLVDAVGVPEVFLIDFDDEDTDVWGDIPVPDIASCSLQLKITTCISGTVWKIVRPSKLVKMGHLPHLKSLRLQDCTDFLPFLFPINSCSLEEVFIAIEDHYVHQWYGKLLDLLNWQRWDVYDFKKHDGSLAIFTSHITQLIESLEWPVDGDFWKADSQFDWPPGHIRYTTRMFSALI
ncbi:hypothetical protein DPV78_003415, partial [Talaromyces pinophilus]